MQSRTSKKNIQCYRNSVLIPQSHYLKNHRFSCCITDILNCLIPGIYTASVFSIQPSCYCQAKSKSVATLYSKVTGTESTSRRAVDKASVVFAGHQSFTLVCTLHSQRICQFLINPANLKKGSAVTRCWLSHHNNASFYFSFYFKFTLILKSHFPDSETTLNNPNQQLVWGIVIRRQKPRRDCSRRKENSS